MGDFDIYVVASRIPHVWGFTGLLAAAVVLLPLTALVAVRGARRTIRGTLEPLNRVTIQAAAIHPDDLSQRIERPSTFEQFRLKSPIALPIRALRAALHGFCRCDATC